MSAGDIYDLRIIEWCKKAYQFSDDISMFCGNIRIKYPQKNMIITRKLPFKKNCILSISNIFQVGQKRNVTFFGGGVLMNTDKVISCGGFLEDLKWLSDWYLYLILGMKYKFFFIDECFATLNVRKRDYSKSLFDWKKNKNVLKNFLNLISLEDEYIFQCFKNCAIMPIYKLKIIILFFSDKNFREYFSFLLLWRLISYNLGKTLSLLVPRKYHDEIRIIFKI